MLFRSAFRNIAVPLVTVIALSFGGLLEGSVLTEIIFSWPGIGSYITKALLSGDMNAVLGGTIAATVLGVLFVPLFFATYGASAAAQENLMGFNGAFYGVLFAMFIYNLFLFISLRERALVQAEALAGAAEQAPDRLRLNVGGGITHDSRAGSEWEEALCKAAFLDLSPKA